MLYAYLIRSGTAGNWTQIQRSRIRFPALPDFLRSSGSGTGSLALWIQLRSYLERKVAAPNENTAVGMCCADHVVPSIHKSLHKATEFLSISHLQLSCHMSRPSHRLRSDYLNSMWCTCISTECIFMFHMSWVELKLWPTVSRPIRLGIGHPFGAHGQIFLFPFFFLLGRPLWREDGSVICSAIYQWSYFLIWDYCVPFPSPLTTRRDYGVSILTRLHTGMFHMVFTTSSDFFL
jgi:hypothetical protein